MEAIQKFVRIYAIESEDEESFLSYFNDCLNRPIIKDDYPANGEKIEIYIGNSLESIFDSNKLRLATGIVALKGIFGLENPKDKEKVIEEELENLTDYPMISDYNHYISLIFEKKIDIDKSDMFDFEYYWLKPEKMNELLNLKFYTSKIFDVITTFIGSSSDLQFFKNIIF